MSFYSSISAYYDEIFPVDQTEMSFINQRLHGCASILDVGCGTGNKTVHLAGRKITAIDGDAEMIAEAKRGNSAPGITYQHLDMQAVCSLGSESFDAALCLGNTLVHLTCPVNIQRFLTELSVLLRPHGICIIQILNYDRILEHKDFSLPVLETPNIKFVRSYEWQRQEMRFVTSLLIKKSGQEIMNNIPLYPLRGSELDAMLKQAGFSQVEYFGSYAGTALQEDSFIRIVIARKS